MVQKTLLGALTVLMLLVAGAGWAGEPVRTGKVTAQLIADRVAAVPGGELRLALVQQIDPGWHTYWRNPGDSGLPTEIAWTLPPGWRAGAIDWPAPERIPVGPLVNHGFHGRVVLPVTLRVPAEAVPGGMVQLIAAASWLVCADICIPEEATLSLTLPIADPAPADPAPADPAHAADFAAADMARPQPSPWPARLERAGPHLTLELAAPDLRAERIAGVWFAAHDSTLLDHAAPQSWGLAAGRLRIELPRSSLGTAPQADASGVLVIDEKLETGPRRLAFALPPDLIAAPVAAQAPSIVQILLAAFAGGLILNLMPCVFPVLVLKGLGLARLGQAGRGAARGQGLAYTAGVLVSFALLGGALLAARAAGHAVGWGFQLQSPPAVLALAYVIFAAGLGLSGGISIGGGLTGAGQSLAARDGRGGAFFTGALAVLVATPCTAPFMAGALGYAVTRPAWEALPVFLTLGLGLAAPFLLLSLSPALARHLPRPGPWMERLKQGLAFPMYATAAWLVWVLAQQSGADGVLAALLGMLLIAFAAWLHGASRGAGRWTRTLGLLGALAGLAGAGALLRLPDAAAAPAESVTGAVRWEPYSPARLTALRAEGRAVFIDATAAWCITCLVNERAALSSARIAAAFREGGVVTLKADWTNRDAAVSALLAAHGRAGVPLYLFYPSGGGAPRELPQLLTEGLVLAALAGQ